jgi:hypothetical protein
MSTPFDPATCVTNSGVTMPRLDAVLAWLQDVHKTIYGSDIDVDPDSPDGQLLGVLAEAYTDLGQILQNIYNGLASPNGAVGPLLSNLVLLNGISRRAGAYTIAPITIEGTAGSSVGTSFIIRNTANGALFSPTATITIGNGQTTATGYAQCHEKGDIAAAAGTLTQIVTVTTGIVGVTNTDGSRGYLVEADGALRARRAQSVAMASQGMTDGLQASIVEVGAGNVLQAIVWENVEDHVVTAGSGTLAPHSIYVVADVIAGSAVDPNKLPTPDPDPIASTIFLKKAQGCNTQGDVVRTIMDAQGKGHIIRYDLPVSVNVYIDITVATRYGWPADGADQIKAAIVEWAAGYDENGNRNISIGGDSNNQLSWTDVLSSFLGKVGGFNLTTMKLGTTEGGGTDRANLPIEFNGIARIDSTRIRVTS